MRLPAAPTAMIRPAAFARAVLLMLAMAGSAWAQTGRVGGVVRDEGGQPLRSVTITASSQQSGATAFTATTDDRGRFSLAGLRPGTWTFSAQAPGYSVEETTLDVRAIGPANPPLTFTLRQLAASGASRLGNIAVRDLQAQLAAADAMVAAQQWDEALKAYRAILSRAPSLTSVHLQIAAVHRQRREFAEALAAYQTILAATPGDEKAIIGAAMTRLEQGDAAAAADELRKAAALDTAGADTYFALGEVLRAQNQTAEATRAYQRAADADRAWAKPRYRLGELAIAAGDADAAARYLRDVIAVAPRSPEADLARAALAGLGT
jgi:Flp pilus assembly protein TadD